MNAGNLTIAASAMIRARDATSSHCSPIQDEYRGFREQSEAKQDRPLQCRHVGEGEKVGRLQRDAGTGLLRQRGKKNGAERADHQPVRQLAERGGASEEASGGQTDAPPDDELRQVLVDDIEDRCRRRDDSKLERILPSAQGDGERP